MRVYVCWHRGNTSQMVLAMSYCMVKCAHSTNLNYPLLIICHARVPKLQVRMAHVIAEFRFHNPSYSKKLILKINIYVQLYKGAYFILFIKVKNKWLVMIAFCEQILLLMISSRFKMAHCIWYFPIFYQCRVWVVKLVFISQYFDYVIHVIPISFFFFFCQSLKWCHV